MKTVMEPKVIIRDLFIAAIIVCGIFTGMAYGADLTESQPATLHYLTSTSDIPAYVESTNKPCKEHQKIYSDYFKLSTGNQCGIMQRYRHWICSDGTFNDGIDVEEYQGKPCPVSEYDKLLNQRRQQPSWENQSQ